MKLMDTHLPKYQQLVVVYKIIFKFHDFSSLQNLFRKCMIFYDFHDPWEHCT